MKTKKLGYCKSKSIGLMVLLMFLAITTGQNMQYNQPHTLQNPDRSQPRRSLAAVCGDGTVEGAEACDDGNTVNGDGCSSTCAVEAGFVCPSNVCQDSCGDGVVMSRKQTSGYLWCDDGNNVNGDGCSSTCQVEIGYYCYGGDSSNKDTCHELCGDGVRLPNNTDTSYCDDGNSYDGDGCSSSCQVETGYICSGGSITTKDSCINNCTVNHCKTCVSEDNTSCAVCDDGFTLKNEKTCSLNTHTGGATDALKDLGEALKIICGVAVTSALITSIMTFTSLVSIWLLVNQIQLFALFSLTNAAVPIDIINFIKETRIFFFSMDFLPFSDSSTYGSITNSIEKEQKEDDLKNIGFDYQSSILNNLGLIIAFTLVTVIHIILFLLPRRSSILDSYSNKIKFNKIIGTVFRIFTFGIYIRLFLQGFQHILIASISEINKFDTSNTSMEISLALAFVIIIITLAFFVVAFVRTCRSPQDEGYGDYKLEEFSSGLRESEITKIYAPLLMLRRYFFVGLLVALSSQESIYLVSSMIVFQICHIILLLVMKAYHSVFNNVVEILNEVLYTALLVMLLGLNKSSRWTDVTKTIFAWIMMINILAICIILTTYMVVELRRACGSEEKLTKTQKIISHADQNITMQKSKAMLNDVPSNPIFSNQSVKRLDSFSMDWSVTNGSPKKMGPRSPQKRLEGIVEEVKY